MITLSAPPLSTVARSFLIHSSSFIHSNSFILINSFIFIHSFIHSHLFILIHSFSFIHSHSSIHSHPFILIHSFSFIFSFIQIDRGDFSSLQPPPQPRPAAAAAAAGGDGADFFGQVERKAKEAVTREKILESIRQDLVRRSWWERPGGGRPGRGKGCVTGGGDDPCESSIVWVGC